MRLVRCCSQHLSSRTRRPPPALEAPCWLQASVPQHDPALADRRQPLKQLSTDPADSPTRPPTHRCAPTPPCSGPGLPVNALRDAMGSLHLCESRGRPDGGCRCGPACAARYALCPNPLLPPQPPRSLRPGSSWQPCSSSSSCQVGVQGGRRWGSSQQCLGRRCGWNQEPWAQRWEAARETVLHAGSRPPPATHCLAPTLRCRDQGRARGAHPGWRRGWRACRVARPRPSGPGLAPAALPSLASSLLNVARSPPTDPCEPLLLQVKFAKHWFWGRWMGPFAQEVSRRPQGECWALLRLDLGVACTPPPAPPHPSCVLHASSLCLARSSIAMRPAPPPARPTRRSTRRPTPRPRPALSRP